MQFDAYTLRKMAPRLLIAVIAVNISIYLCLAAVDLTNIVGKGLGQLLLTPFQDTILNIKIKDNYTNNIVGAGAAGIIGGAGLLSAAGILGVVLGNLWTASVAGAALAAAGTIGAALLPFLFLAVVGIGFVALAVLLTVIIRQGLIVFLIIISPIAIALFVLPGTEKYFRQWWSVFLKTLMVYPIIAAIFAVSDILGAIIFSGATKGSVTGAAGLAMIMTGIIVIYAPLFLIPFAFKFAGGVLGAINDIAQGQAGKASGGLRQRIRQSADNPNSWLGGMKKRSKETRQDMGLTAGHVFGGSYAGLKSLGRREGFRRGYGADARVRSSRLANKAARESQELDAAKEIAPDDDTNSAYMVAQRGGNRTSQDAELARVAPTRFKRDALDHTDAERMGFLKRNAETGAMEWNEDLGGEEGFNKLLQTENTATAIAARRKNADDALAQIGNLAGRVGGRAGQQMAVRNIAGTTTGYKTNAEMTQRVIEASRRADGSVDMQQVAITLGETKKAAMGVGRVDYGGSSFTRHIAVAQELANGTMTLDEAEKQLSASVIKKQSAGTLATMDTRSMEVMAPHLTVELEQAMDAARTAAAEAARTGGEVTPVMKDRRVQAAAAKLGNLYDSLNYANSGNADILANVMGGKKHIVEKIGTDGNANRDENGGLITVEQNAREIIEEMRGDPNRFEHFANIRKDWSVGRTGEVSEKEFNSWPEERQAEYLAAQGEREAEAARHANQERPGGQP